MSPKRGDMDFLNLFPDEPVRVIRPRRPRLYRLGCALADAAARFAGVLDRLGERIYEAAADFRDWAGPPPQPPSSGYAGPAPTRGV